MKAILGCLSDPYFHVFLVGLVLARLAMGTSGDSTDLADRPSNCPACRATHEASKPCPRIAARIESALHRP
jgi:hypothetical protein